MLVSAVAQAQDLADPIRADLYLLEATNAVKSRDHAGAIRALRKIEGLKFERTPAYLFRYGRTLVEAGIGAKHSGAVRQGLDALKRSLTEAKPSAREKAYYHSALVALAQGKKYLVDAAKAAAAAAAAKARAEEERKRRCVSNCVLAQRNRTGGYIAHVDRIELACPLDMQWWRKLEPSERTRTYGENMDCRREYEKREVAPCERKCGVK